MPRECNFRRGRGATRERFRALSREGYAYTWRWLHEGTMYFYMLEMSKHTK